MNTNSDIFKTLKLDSIKLSPTDLPSKQEKETWVGRGEDDGAFIGKEGSNFYVDLPPEYNYNNDIRLGGTNSFIVEDKNYPQYKFTLVGEEISQFFQNSEDLNEFKNSMNSYLEKIISSLKKGGVEISEKDFKLQGIETEKSWWCRAIISYKMNTKIYWKSSGYNTFGKALTKILGGGKALEKAGYEKDKDYQEIKIIDFFYPKLGYKNPFFALVYNFDEITGGDNRKRMRAINGVSESLGYWDRSKED